MSQIHPEYLYNDEHLWIRKETNDSATIGLTDHGQDFLGELVYVELPHVGTEFKQGDETGVVESVKTATDLYAPLSGVVTQINSTLEIESRTINQDPYQTGWLFQITLSNPQELDQLLSAEAYRQLLTAEASA